MKLILAEPKYFKESVNIISELVGEAKFRIDNDGMQLIAMDPANVAMVVFRLLVPSFTRFEIKKPEEIAINLHNLKQVLRRIKPNDVLSLELSEDKFKIELKGDNTRSFLVPLIDLEEKEQRVPELNFPYSIEMNSGVFSDLIEDVGVVAESVTLIGEKDKVTLKAEGDLSKANIEVMHGAGAVIKSTTEKIKAKYSVEYLKKMVGASKLCEMVSISFNNDYPMRLDYKEIDKMMVSFILAPRVDND